MFEELEDRVHAPAEPVKARRADAQRNISAILDAGMRCLAHDPEASINDIAKEAGVGRVTLYGHFPSRSELIDAVFAHTVAEADAALDGVDLSGDPREALTRLVAATWRVVNACRSLLVAAQRTLPAARIRAHHDAPMRRLLSLIDRGRAEGVFRTDLPAPWLVATYYSVLHGAADEINAGRLSEEDAARVITRTLLAAFTPPGSPMPDDAPPDAALPGAAG